MLETFLGPNENLFKNIIDQCDEAYCSSLAVEYVGIVKDVDEYRWLQKEVEVDAASDSLDENNEVGYSNICFRQMPLKVFCIENM